MTFAPPRQRTFTANSVTPISNTQPNALPVTSGHVTHPPLDRTASLPASQSISLPIQQPSNSAVNRNFLRIMPHFGVSSSAKARPIVRKYVIMLTAFLTLTVFFVTHLSAPTLLPANENLIRYSQASAHFRKSMTSDQLDLYYRQREAALRASVSADALTPPKNAILLQNVTSPYFNTCIVASESSTFHPALKRGPDVHEINGRAFAKQPRDFEDVFSVIDRNRFLFDADRKAVQTIDKLGAGFDTDYDDAVKVARAVTERDIAATLHDVTVPIAYLRTTRRDGWQIVVNIAGSANRTVNGEAKRANMRRLVTVTKGFGSLCEVTLVRPREVVRINVLVPYSNRPHRIAAFLGMFANYFDAVNTVKVRIIVSTTVKERAKVLELGRSFEELDVDRFVVVSSDGDEFGNFSRAVALREAAQQVPKDEILFISDTDLTIGANFIQNCRVNVVQGFQVWFPVMFSLYPYGRRLSSMDGMWRRSSYGMACMYHSDFQKVGGFGPDEETSFTGWGSEDVFLYNRFRDVQNYAVFRTLEPGLQHQWHGKECEHNEHYENCMRTVYMTIGSQDVMAKLMVDAHVDLTNLTRHALPV